MTDFVPLEDIDPVFYEHTYWLAPDGDAAAKPYGLLLAAMADQQRVGIGTVVMRTKQYLAAVRPFEGALAMSTMRFADEVVPRADIDQLPKKLEKPSKKELGLARQIVDALATDWEPERYHDTFTEELRDLIEHKDDGDDVVVDEPDDGEGDAKVLDLMEALQASIDQSRSGRRSASGTSKKKGAPAKKATKKTAGPTSGTSAKKKAPGKTAATKKTAATRRHRHEDGSDEEAGLLPVEEGRGVESLTRPIGLIPAPSWASAEAGGGSGGCGVREGQHAGRVGGDQRRHLGHRQAQHVVGDGVDERPSLLVVVRAGDRREPLPAHRGELGRGLAQEAPQGEGQGEVVDHRRTAEQRRPSEGDGHAAGHGVLVGLTGGEHEPAVELPGQLQGVALVGAGRAQLGAARLEAVDLAPGDRPSTSRVATEGTRRRGASRRWASARSRERPSAWTLPARCGGGRRRASR